MAQEQASKMQRLRHEERQRKMMAAEAAKMQDAAKQRQELETLRELVGWGKAQV